MIENVNEGYLDDKVSSVDHRNCIYCITGIRKCLLRFYVYCTSCFDSFRPQLFLFCKTKYCEFKRFACLRPTEDSRCSESELLLF